MKKRRLNVQQQNAVLKEEIQCTAHLYISNSPYACWVSEVLLLAGLHPNQGMLARCNVTPDQMGQCAYATWLTWDSRFYEIEAMIEYDTFRLISVESVRDASPEIIVSNHQRGTGRSFGAIALEVLSELTTGADSGISNQHN